MCNITYDWITDTEAVVESYYICYQRLKSAEHVEGAFGAVSASSDQTLQLTAVGRYIDRFLHEDNSWLIAHRPVTLHVLKADPTPLDVGRPTSLLSSGRAPED